MLDVFAFIVLLVLAAVVIAFIVVIGNIPGNIARNSGHPQADAISALAWIGLITGIGWFAALIWAKTKPVISQATLEQRIIALERAQETQ